MKDPVGKAIYDYHFKGKAPDIHIDTNYTEDETVPPAWFFRSFDEMSAIEKKALELCRGKILDVGAGAGTHSLILQENKADVTALEISPAAVKVMSHRGIQKIENKDLFDFTGPRFDTILILMNGTGIGGTLEGLKKMLNHLKNLMAPDGRILIDSSDIRYLFEEEDGSIWMELTTTRYYGEMEYEVTYKNEKAKFNWLFIDAQTFEKVATLSGFRFEVVALGDHYDYLACLSLQ